MKNYILEEKNYDMAMEAYYGTMFTLSNGYMGIRGSLEENGSISVQGAFIRGLIDEIPFNQNIKIDNEYMRKYYINEDAAKAAEYQEGVINFADILFLQIKIDGETFYPWEGTLKSWKRILNIKENTLTREVIWENSKGDITKLTFIRFASFSCDHIFAQRVVVTPVNHNKSIEILSGIDLRTKSNGFKMCKAVEHSFDRNTINLKLQTKGKYGHYFNIGVQNSLTARENIDNDDYVYQKFDVKGEVTLDKIIHISTSRDMDYRQDYYGDFKSYDQHFEEHISAWQKYFEKLDIEISGDDEADFSVRFCTYQTAVSICRNDSIHSLGAKNLTGEAYNNYVWWDCEIYQAPVFLYSGAEGMKNLLMYRYNKLSAAKEIAEKEGRIGARYPFISAVTGEERVWKHVRHPFMQYHVVADVAWNLINYYNATGDKEYMRKYGIEVLGEIADYWTSRVEWKNDRYEICGVTGCDEHHPYVDNDAYTNYLVKYVLDSTVRISCELNRKINEKWCEVSRKIYLPMEACGLIPQFDGYLDLSRTLETHGGEHSNFQMKTAGGLYHKSQIIKQPDVMVLFSHTDFDMTKDVYEINWDYYENMCEASSSLTYPTHAVCAFDNNQLYKGYKYLMKCSRIDLDDIHGGADDGIHAGCAAGSWYAIVRGLLGVKITKDRIEINPKLVPWWKGVKCSVVYKGIRILIHITKGKCTLKADNNVEISFKGQNALLKSRKKKEFSL